MEARIETKVLIDYANKYCGLCRFKEMRHIEGNTYWCNLFNEKLEEEDVDDLMIISCRKCIKARRG